MITFNKQEKNQDFMEKLNRQLKNLEKQVKPLIGAKKGINPFYEPTYGAMVAQEDKEQP